MRLENLHRKRKVDTSNPYLRNGRLISPPRITKKQLDEEENRRQEKRRRKEINVHGLVSLQDLLTGEHWRRKEQEKLKKDRARERFRLKREQQKKEKAEMFQK